MGPFCEPIPPVDWSDAGSRPEGRPDDFLARCWVAGPRYFLFPQLREYGSQLRVAGARMQLAGRDGQGLAVFSQDGRSPWTEDTQLLILTKKLRNRPGPEWLAVSPCNGHPVGAVGKRPPFRIDDHGLFRTLFGKMALGWRPSSTSRLRTCRLTAVGNS